MRLEAKIEEEHRQRILAEAKVLEKQQNEGQQYALDTLGIREQLKRLAERVEQLHLEQGENLLQNKGKEGLEKLVESLVGELKT